MLKTTRLIATLIFCAIASFANAQTGGTAWRVNRAGSPYDVQINLDGIWYNFAKLSDAGAVTFDPAKITFMQAGTGTATRTLDDRLKGIIEVTDFSGVDKTGASSSVAGFQAAIDSTPNSSTRVIHVPPGTYLGDMTTLTYGNRSVLFFEEGGVSYSTAAPRAARTNYSIAANGPIASYGQFYLSYSPIGAAGEYSAMSIIRNSAYTAGTALNPSALLVTTNISTNTGTKDNSIIGVINDSSASNSGKSRTAGMFQANRNAANGSNFITLNSVAQDNTGLGSTNADGAVVAGEFDVYSSGPDNIGLGRRIGIDVISLEQQVSVDGATSMRGGVRVRNTGNSTWTNAFLVQPDKSGTGGIDVAFSVLNGDVPTIIKTRDLSSKVFLDLGTDLSAGTILQIQNSARDSANAIIPYSNIKSGISSNASGSASGNLSFETRISGTMTTGMTLGNGIQIGAPTGGGKGTGTINVATGIYANGTAGISATKTVRDSAGTGTCTLIFTQGLLTGGTC